MTQVDRGDDAAYAALDDRLGFLTPILKGFLTEMGVECASLGIQIFGGHGYIKSNKREPATKTTPSPTIASEPRIVRGTVRSPLRSKISRGLGPIFFFSDAVTLMWTMV